MCVYLIFSRYKIIVIGFLLPQGKIREVKNYLGNLRGSDGEYSRRLGEATGKTWGSLQGKPGKIERGVM
jgi:hypothetical protein